MFLKQKSQAPAGEIETTMATSKYATHAPRPLKWELLGEPISREWQVAEVRLMPCCGFVLFCLVLLPLVCRLGGPCRTAAIRRLSNSASKY